MSELIFVCSLKFTIISPLYSSFIPQYELVGSLYSLRYIEVVLNSLLGCVGLVDNLNLTVSESAYLAFAFFIVILTKSDPDSGASIFSRVDTCVLSSHLISKYGGNIVFVSDPKYFKFIEEVVLVSRLSSNFKRIPLFCIELV